MPTPRPPLCATAGRNPRAAGIGYLGTGAAFLAIAWSGQPAFLGLGFAFIGLGLAFIARGRRER